MSARRRKMLHTRRNTIYTLAVSLAVPAMKRTVVVEWNPDQFQMIVNKLTTRVR